MKTKIHSAFRSPHFALGLALLATLNLQPSTFAQGTAFTYQGRLLDTGGPANGNYDMRFYLRDALSGGNPVGATNNLAPVAVSNGLFTVVLDYGSGIFTGAARWLEIAVRTNGSVSAYTVLLPREALTAVPYALYSPSAGTAVSISGAVPAAQVSGVLPAAALPANVALRDANQTFTGGNLFSGAVGINTSNTIQVLTVGQAEPPLNTGSQVGVYDAAQAFIVTRQTTTDVEATFGVDSAAGVLSVLSDHPLVFRAGSGAGGGNIEYLRIASGGNVGIHTTAPQSPLDVLGGNWDLSGTEGDFRIGTPSYRLKMGVANAGGGAGDTRIRAVGGTGRLMLGSGTLDVLSVVSNKVGINTITPGSALEVIGTVTASGFSGNGAVSWQPVAGTSQQAQPNQGYLLTNNALVTLTLPGSPNIGDVVRVSGTGAAGWRILQNAGQFVLAKNIPGSASFAWAPRDDYRNWQAVASSADGTKLVAVVWGGLIYTSTDRGASWIARASSQYWSGVASSTDGTKLAAVVAGVFVFTRYVYTSQDSGVTWTAHASDRSWTAVASSGDGSKLVATVGAGQIYTSADYGSSWTARESNRDWQAVASSADGSKLVAVVYGGQIYTSTDSGVSWTPRESARNWESLASSSDGTKLVAVVNGGRIYTSTDSGVSWTPRESSRSWWSVASSTDGSKLVAVVYGGQTYISVDSGVTWTARENSRNWVSVASSADGSKLVAAEFGGQIYVSVPGSTSGTSGYLLGDQYSAIELQYTGGAQFLPLSFTGNILAY
jgi:hypothetical protein